MSPLELLAWAGAIVALALAVLTAFLVGWFIIDTIRTPRR